ncbi:hypothetical protein AAFF_G00232110 [Aldrovandia affinis]|uniref:SH3 domain-containing protein n=1 Tax=Aldrovandia affinis TaxID=143900 RepID=A0AAD7W4X0_9TELE|nr:hypothetical protein AAFF_G00232110 [Aldrovandia affinis]
MISSVLFEGSEVPSRVPVLQAAESQRSRQQSLSAPDSRISVPQTVESQCSGQRYFNGHIGSHSKNQMQTGPLSRHFSDMQVDALDRLNTCVSLVSISALSALASRRFQASVAERLHCERSGHGVSGWGVGSAAGTAPVPNVQMAEYSGVQSIPLCGPPRRTGLTWVGIAVKECQCGQMLGWLSFDQRSFLLAFIEKHRGGTQPGFRPQNLMAKALYDNVPESPEELAFRKGDILTVIEQNTGGLEGWWLCSLHGRQGIAPGNRLKLLIGPMFEAQPPSTQATPPGPAYQQKPGAPQGSTLLPSSHQSTQQGVYQVPPSKDLYQVPQRSPWAADGMASKVVTPMRVGQSYTYDSVQRHQQDVYDVPPVRPQGVYDIPPVKQGPLFPGKLGDPRTQGIYDIPPTAQSVYDIPPTAQSVYNIPDSAKRLRHPPDSAKRLRRPTDNAREFWNGPIPVTVANGTFLCLNSAAVKVKDKIIAVRAELLSPAVYSVPPCRNNPALQEGNYDFPQPLKAKPGGVYDVLPTTMARPAAQSNYDFPPSSELASHRGAANSHSGVYDVPPVQRSAGPQGDVYDIPRGAGDYDVPPQEPRLLGDVTDGVNRLSFSSTGSARSSMSTSSSASSTPEPRGGPDLDSAMQRLGQLQQGVEAAVSALLTLAASPLWRTAQVMDEVQGTLDRVRAAVADLLAFGRATAGSALSLSDRSLQAKLRRQLQRLEDSQQILLQIGHAPEAGGKVQSRCDDLDRFVMVSRTVPDDVKQLASTVSGSAELLFRRAAVTGPLPQGGALDGRHPANVGPATDNEVYDGQPERDQTAPFPVPSSLQQEKDNLNHSEKCVKSWMEDYDYVHLQGKEEFERQQKELLDKENITKQSKVQLEQEQLNQFKQLEQEVIKPVDNDITQWISHQQPTGPSPSSDSSSLGESQLCGWDRQLLCFYSEQCEAHFVTLLNAVDAFFSCISSGQPPRIFVAHSKFVILSAHKLVFIGDTLSRQASAPHLASRVMNCSNALCELLKTVVGATKTAALHYPNTAALQEMVDRVTDLSHQAQQFKVQLLQLASC